MAFTITNNLDDAALYIGLKRLPGETNELFAARIKRFSKFKYGSDSETIINSCLEQIGLKKTPVAVISCNDPFTMSIDNDFLTLESFPASSSSEYVRVFINTKSSNYTESIPGRISAAISSSDSYNIDYIDIDGFNSLTKENLLNGSNSKLITDVISQKRTKFNSANIIESSIKSSSAFVSNRVESLQDIKYSGDYYVNGDLSYIEIHSEPKSAFIVTYIGYEKLAIIYKTEFNILPLDTYAKYGISDSFVYLLNEYLKGRSLG